MSRIVAIQVPRSWRRRSLRRGRARFRRDSFISFARIHDKREDIIDECTRAAIVFRESWRRLSRASQKQIKSISSFVAASEGAISGGGSELAANRSEAGRSREYTCAQVPSSVATPRSAIRRMCSLFAACCSCRGTWQQFGALVNK